MHNLIEFIRRHSHWLLLLVLEILSVLMLFRWGHYQASVCWSLLAEASSSVAQFRSSVTSYFGLRAENEQLTRRNALLEMQLDELKNRAHSDNLQLVHPDSARVVCMARVVNNSVVRPDNFITIDKGSLHGVRPEMGVVDGVGVVGIVWHVSPHFALVLPVLNKHSNVSCRISRTGYFGTLQWDGGNPLYVWMKDVPRHSEFTLGDTVVTSGYSTVFPPGIIVGTVDDMGESEDGLSYQLKIRLATDLSRLSNVCVIDSPRRDERAALEDSVSMKH